MNENKELEQILDSHRLKGGSLNLGQYKSQYECFCGLEIIEDGHADDYQNNIYLLHQRHVLELIQALITRKQNEARIDELNLLFERSDDGYLWPIDLNSREEEEYLKQRQDELQGEKTQ